MKPTYNQVMPTVRKALFASGILFEDLVMKSKQIIAFGSTAFDLISNTSDVDLLCLGPESENNSQKIDLIWISPRDLSNRVWLESELATHVARYGIWLHGKDNWSFASKVSTMTMNFKIKSIFERIEAIRKRSRFMQTSYLNKHAIRIRRDLQRLWLLHCKQPVIATSILDYTWEMESAKNDALSDLFSIGHFRDSTLKEGYKLVENYIEGGFIEMSDYALRTKIELWLSKNLSYSKSLSWSKIDWKLLNAE